MKPLKIIKITFGLVFLFTLSARAEEQSNTGSAANATAQQSTTLQQTSAAPEKKQWSASYLNETRYARDAAAAGNGSAQLLHRIALGHKFELGTLSLNQAWTQNQNMVTNQSQFTATDPWLKFAFKPIKLNHGWTLNASTRYYFPVSTASKAISSNGRLRADLEFKKPLTDRIAFTYYTLLDQALQTQPSSLKPDNGSINSKISGKIGLPADSKFAYVANRRYSHWNILGLEYEINKKWTLVQNVGITNTITYADPAHGISAHNDDTLEVWTYLGYTYSPSVSFTFGLEQSRGAAARQHQDYYTFMADNETNYYLALYLGI